MFVLKVVGVFRNGEEKLQHGTHLFLVSVNKFVETLSRQSAAPELNFLLEVT